MPVRIVRNLHKINNFTDAKEQPLPVHRVHADDLSDRRQREHPVSPGDVIQYEVPDMYGRPWDSIWRKYFEQGMKRPEEKEVQFKFD